MKTIFLPLALFTIVNARAQKAEKAYALTAETKGAYVWNQIREVDLKTGETKALVFDGKKIPTISFASKIQRPANNNAMVANAYAQNGTISNGAAALAFDKSNNRLYFSPMFIGGSVRYIDLADKSLTPHEITFEQTLNEADAEASNITRMVIGADGYGYGITNDANTFIRFSTGKNAGVKTLGKLTDDPANGTSIHDRCNSWGGDIFADAYGSLYVISAKQNVFQINPLTQVATHLGTINGLPADFSCNGAAVNAAGEIVISGATYTKGYFTVDLATMQAKQLAGNSDVFNASDLATSNLYKQNEADKSLDKMATIQLKESGENVVSMYPNPVTNGKIVIAFNKITPGDYTIDLTGQAAQTVNRKQVTVNTSGQTTVLNADGKLAKGLYIVRVANAQNKQVFNSKILVQ